MGQSELADWIAAIGQVLGAIGTLAAVVVALSIARRDGRQLRLERREREASQARRVTTRTERKWNEIADGQISGIIVSNNSDQSILSLSLMNAILLGANLQWFGDEEARAGIEVLAPNSSHEFTGTWKVIGPHVQDAELSVRTTVRFVDSSGTWWDRVNNNEPVRSYDGPAESEKV